jgi:hypothetical protein
VAEVGVGKRSVSVFPVYSSMVHLRAASPMFAWRYVDTLQFCLPVPGFARTRLFFSWKLCEPVRVTNGWN